MRKLIGNIFQAQEKFKLIKDGDRICVGISGGKDSMGLIYALKIWSQVAKKKLGINIELVAVHLKFSLCAIDYRPLEDFFAKETIPFYIIDTPRIAKMIKGKAILNKSPCGICSKMKKAALIEAAKKYKCNKVAMGHHGDDAIETLFMNMIHEGRLAIFKPKMFLTKSQMWFIRPLSLSREKDITKAVKQAGIPVLNCSCPLEGSTQRDIIKEWIKQQFYQNPQWNSAYANFMTAIMNEDQCSLWFDSHFKKTNNNIQK